MTAAQYANRAQKRFLELLAQGSNVEANGWGKVVVALFAGNGDEAVKRCQEWGFEAEALEIAKIFASGIDSTSADR